MLKAAAKPINGLKGWVPSAAIQAKYDTHGLPVPDRMECKVLPCLDVDRHDVEDDGGGNLMFAMEEETQVFPPKRVKPGAPRIVLLRSPTFIGRPQVDVDTERFIEACKQAKNMYYRGEPTVYIRYSGNM